MRHTRRGHRAYRGHRTHKAHKAHDIHQRGGMSRIDPYPPGGAYKVGGLNGLTGGHYYSYNDDPTLQTRILSQGSATSALKALGQTLAPGVAGQEVLRGGRRRRRATRKHRKATKAKKSPKTRKAKHSKKKSHPKKYKKYKNHKKQKGAHCPECEARQHQMQQGGKRMRRRSRHRYGGSGLRSLIPADMVSLGRQTGYGVSSMYRGLVGERFGTSPSVMVQPASESFHM